MLLASSQGLQNILPHGLRTTEMVPGDKINAITLSCQQLLKWHERIYFDVNSTWFVIWHNWTEQTLSFYAGESIDGLHSFCFIVCLTLILQFLGFFPSFVLPSLCRWPQLLVQRPQVSRRVSSFLQECQQCTLVLETTTRLRTCAVSWVQVVLGCSHFTSLETVSTSHFIC